MIKWTPYSFLAMALLSGCTVGPDYHAPNVAVPSGYSESHGGYSVSMEASASWWEQLHDLLLTKLIEKARSDNYDVRTAGIRVREARLQQVITGGAGGPKVNASAQASEARLSANALPSGLSGLLGVSSGSSSSGGLGAAGTEYSTYQTGFDASWEIDLFGGQRRADEAAVAQTEAAIWTSRDSEVTLAAEVARTYTQYRLSQARIAVADAALAAGQEALELSRVRSDKGLADSSGIDQQETSVAQLSATRDSLVAQRQAQLHALAYLLGPGSDDLVLEVSTSSSETPIPVEVPVGLPSDLLLRRPDVRAAERQLAAATAKIGVAKADLFPKLSLTGAAQLASQSLSNLLDSDSLQGNVAAKLSLPIVDGRVKRNTVKLREAQTDEAVQAYHKQVFTAFRDVQDALSQFDADRRRLQTLQQAEAAARNASDTADVRYRTGLTPLSDVLTARQTWLTSQDATLQAQATTTQDAIALYKALGGGWDATGSATQEGPSSAKSN